ncbi:hypothetical protein GCM10027200_53730 [Lentzea nigeriaca]
MQLAHRAPAHATNRDQYSTQGNPGRPTRRLLITKRRMRLARLKPLTAVEWRCTPFGDVQLPAVLRFRSKPSS